MKKLLKNILLGLVIVVITVVLTFSLRKYFFNFDKRLTKEQKEIIEKYISDKNNSYLEENMTFTSTHYFGSRYNNDVLEVYMWVFFSEYDTSNGKFDIYQEINAPYVIVINTKDEKFEIIDSWVLKEKVESKVYNERISKRFPLAMKDQVIDFMKSGDYKKLKKEHMNLIKIYEDYSKESE